MAHLKRESFRSPESKAANAIAAANTAMGKADKEQRRAEKKKLKAEAKAEARVDDQTGEQPLPVTRRYLSPIASPLANPSLAANLLKTVKKATAARACRRGIKEVCKALRKGEKGIVVLAADVYPVDVLAHLPVLCEDHEIPYAFVPSKHDIGTAGCTRRPASAILVMAKKTADLADDYAACVAEMKSTLTYAC